MATFFLSGPSASLTIPYVPAPRVLPNLYFDLLFCQYHRSVDKPMCYILLVVTIRLAVKFVQHVGDWNDRDQRLS
jgi:hypothetical protein